MEESSSNGNHNEEMWTEQEYNDTHGFTCTIKLDTDNNMFLIAVVLNGAKIEVSRSYNAFYELNDYLRTSIEFSSHVESLPELPSSEAAYANCMVLENWLELVRVHMGEYLWQCRRMLCFLDDTMEKPNLKDCQLSILRRKMAELTVAYRMLSMKLYNNEGAFNDLVERLMYLESQQNSINHHQQQQQQQLQLHQENQHHYHHNERQYLQQQQRPQQLTNLEAHHDNNTSLSLVSGILGDILFSIEDKASAASTATIASNVDSNGGAGVTKGVNDTTNGAHINGCTSSVDDGTSENGSTTMNGKHDLDGVDKNADVGLSTTLKDREVGIECVAESGMQDETAPSQMSQSNLTAPSQPIAEGGLCSDGDAVVDVVAVVANDEGQPAVVVVVPAMTATKTTATATTETATSTAAAATATAATTTTTTETGSTEMKDQGQGSNKASCLMNRALAALNSR